MFRYTAPAVLVAVLAGLTQPPKTPEGEILLSSQIEFRISVPKATFFQLEPVPVRLEFHNPNGREARVPRHLAPEYGQLSFVITDPNGSSRPRRPLYHYLWGSMTRTVTLSPYTVLLDREVLHYGAGDGFFFRSVGRYQIQGSVLGRQSNVVTIEVTEPGPDDVAGRQLFDDRVQAGFIIDEGVDHEVAKLLETFVRSKQQSVYSAYARYGLGKYWSNRSNPGKDYDKSVKEFEELLRQHPDFPLRPEVEYRIAKANYEKATEQFLALSREYPDWLLARKAYELLQRSEVPRP